MFLCVSVKHHCVECDYREMTCGSITEYHQLLSGSIVLLMIILDTIISYVFVCFSITASCRV